MRALLDVNVLIALLDASHIHHRQVTDWLEKNINFGWASCPITQNGCIRILSQPSYPNSISAAKVAERLTDATQDQSHEFWPDAISILQLGKLEWDKVLSSRHITDVYLLALAIRQSGCFVTLDQGVPLKAVSGALRDHLVIIS